MRMRFSLWDPVVAAGGLLETWTAAWLMRHLEGPVPLHWGLTGAPDRFGDPSWFALLFGPAIAVVLFVMLRLVDAVHAARNEDGAGFLTNFGGGLAVFMLLLGGLAQWSTWQPATAYSPMPLIGLMFAFMGWQFQRAPAIPINTTGLLPNTPAARDAVRRTLGKGFCWTGLLAFALSWLPGPWSVVALVAVLVGPLASVIAAFVQASSS